MILKQGRPSSKRYKQQQSICIAMALAGVELRYLVRRIQDMTQGYYVSNIYGVDRNSILFKLHHPEKPDILLMLSTAGMWITNVRIQQVENNRLVRRLRGDLRRLRLIKVEQPGLDRLVYLRFGGFDREFVLVGEFFGDGNIILCNDTMKVLALQHAIEVRHRTLKVGLQYEQPPGPKRDALDMQYEDFQEIATRKDRCVRWVGMNMGLPRRYAEGIMHAANVDPKSKGESLSDEQIRAIYESATGMVQNIIEGNHTPVILRSENTEVSAVKIDDTEGEQVDDFMEGLDRVFTENILERGQAVQSDVSTGRATRLQNRLVEQKKAIQTVQNRATAIRSTADSMYTMLSAGILRLDSDGADVALAQTGAKLIREKGAPFVSILDQKISVKLSSPLQSIASTLYSEAKKQSAAVPAIQKMIAKTQRSMEKETNKAQAERETVSVRRVRSRHWFERYRWFYTSDGLLAIGGRDAPSNSAVVRKHMEAGDRVFHAEIFGSPFFILKSSKEPPPASLTEAARATVCFSRVWREGMYGSSAYWVMPEQVKKSAPTGQYLPKGSFTIEGRRNFVRSPGLRLAIGMMQHDGDDLLMCGPEEAVSKHSEVMVVIEPGNLEMVAAAKKIKHEFMRMNVQGAEQYTIDDYVRILPAGGSRIVESHDKT